VDVVALPAQFRDDFLSCLRFHQGSFREAGRLCLPSFWEKYGHLANPFAAFLDTTMRRAWVRNARELQAD
jgi:hypothetical protein